MRSCRTEQLSENTESQSDRVKTPVANLVRYKPSGIYFARFVRGKLFRHSLKTDVIRLPNSSWAIPLRKGKRIWGMTLQLAPAV